MKTIAFVAYPGITPLDLVGPLQVFSTLADFHPDFEVVVAAQNVGPLPTDTPLSITPSHTFDQVPDPHVVIVPGGSEPTLRALTDQTLLGYLRSVSPTVTASVCSGALVLGAAGLLKGREATTHWAFLNLPASAAEQLLDLPGTKPFSPGRNQTGLPIPPLAAPRAARRPDL